tara:strand:- start:2431 stop:3579 length:1149 start_codon:yes stop_codon:yes gene_type:complete
MDTLSSVTNFGQTSINEFVDKNKIINYLTENIKTFEKIVKESNDNPAKDFFKEFSSCQTISFPITKQQELFFDKNISDVNKIINYLIFRYKFYICGRKKINIGYPPYVLVELVSTCNLRCPFCFQTDKSFTKKPYMGVIDFDFYKKVIDEANELKIGAITLGSRGEPTLHKKINEVIEYTSNKQNIYEIKINTNASFLNEKLCHTLLKNNISQIVISSDHYEKENYERLRLNSNFEKIVENVDRLFNIRKNYYPNSQTEIRVSGVDNERNLDRQKFYTFWKKRSDHVTAGFPLERWNTYENSTHENIKDPCEFLWDRMYVWFDGKVNPCDADYKSHLSFGNLKNDSIKKVWNGIISKKIRADHLDKRRNKHVPCDRCGVTFV